MKIARLHHIWCILPFCRPSRAESSADTTNHPYSFFYDFLKVFADSWIYGNKQSVLCRGRQRILPQICLVLSSLNRSPQRNFQRIGVFVERRSYVCLEIEGKTEKEQT